MTNCKCTVGDVETPEPLKCRCHDVALPDGRYEHATIIVEAGCITAVESGEIPLYTPHVCCTGVGGGSGAGVQGRPGDKGEPGENATITIGVVNTLAPGSQATVKNVGSETNAILEFGIPAGAEGSTGQGSNGITSDAGGFSIENGSIVALPASWPPVLYLLAQSETVGASLVATDPDQQTGIVRLTLNLTQYDTSLRQHIADSITAAVTPLQNQINALNTALSAAQSAIADLQRRVP